MATKRKSKAAPRSAAAFKDNMMLMVDGSSGGGGAAVAPALTTVAPNSLPPGSPDTVITVTGTGFVTGCLAHITGPGFYDYPATFVSATEVTFTLPASVMVVAVGIFASVSNPGSPKSNAKNIAIQ